MFVLVLVLATLTGISLGMLGGGGSTLTVPILAYVAGMPPDGAITSSLFVVAVTSAIAAVVHARLGRVEWRTGVIVGSAGVFGSYFGGRLSSLVPGDTLMMVFALMMIGAAVAMLRGRPAMARLRTFQLAPAIALGVAIGLLSGLVGAGGGFLVVPALIMLGGLPVERAIATSLVVIAMQSAAGFFGHLAAVDVEWPLTLGVTVTAVAGSLVGGLLARRIPAAASRRGFAALVIAVAVVVLVEQAFGYNGAR